MLQVLLAILMGLTAASVAAQDPVIVSPKNNKVEIDNDWVRVLRVRQGPHEKTPMHEHPASVVVYLTNCDQKRTGADGRVQEVKQKAGDVAYIDAVKHATENISGKPLEEVIVELKPDAPKNPSPPVTLDPVKLDPQHVTVAFENERVRVLHTVLAPHIKDPMHEHPHYVVVYLTELHTTMLLGDGRAIDNVRRPGEIAFRDTMKHSTENIGDRDAAEIQVELK
ncbi:MAG: hypothetical protein WBC04_11010 [Candidatus Acidiferrales bacterium]